MKVAFLLLLASVSVAAAAPCAAKGPSLFRFDRVRGIHVDSTTMVYDSGAVVSQGYTEDGKPASRGEGCLDKATMAKVRTAVKSSPWKVTKATVTCDAISATSTVYYVNGTKLFTETLCGAESLDAKSAKAAKELEAILLKQ